MWLFGEGDEAGVGNLSVIECLESRSLIIIIDKLGYV